MTIRTLTLGSALLALSAPSLAFAQGAPPEPQIAVGYPHVLAPSPPPPRPEVWYGWQSLIGVSVGLTVGIVPSIFSPAMSLYLWPAGLGGVVFSGPIAHWAHKRVGRGFAVLGMNVGAGVLGLVVGGIPVACAVEKCDGFYFVYGLVGSYVGATIAAALDIALLSKYQPPEPRVGARPSFVESLTPILDVGRGRTVFGLQGAF